ncbi:MAG: DUF3015 family protein [Deltaproteobacteria bacterium]
MRTSFSLIVSVSIFVSSISLAAKSATLGLNDVGSDSCGLGWQITQKKSFAATTTRGTTNAFVPPSFGMTSGTLGCDKHSFVKNEEAGVMFALANQEPLSIEMARGEGEYVAGFAQALGCRDVSSFGRMTQDKYTEIISENSSAIQMYKNIKQQIAQDSELSASCGV